MRHRLLAASFSGVASTGKRRCDRPARRGVARARRALPRASFRTSACTAAALDLVLRPDE